MLVNLKNLITDKNITYKDLANLLNLTEKTVYSKISEKTDFTLVEIKKIHKFIFPEYDLQYLFASDKTA